MLGKACTLVSCCTNDLSGADPAPEVHKEGYRIVSHILCAICFPVTPPQISHGERDSEQKSAVSRILEQRTTLSTPEGSKRFVQNLVHHCQTGMMSEVW